MSSTLWKQPSVFTKHHNTVVPFFVNISLTHANTHVSDSRHGDRPAEIVQKLLIRCKCVVNNSYERKIKSSPSTLTQPSAFFQLAKTRGTLISYKPLYGWPMNTHRTKRYTFRFEACPRWHLTNAHRAQPVAHKSIIIKILNKLSFIVCFSIIKIKGVRVSRPTE